LPVSPRLTQTPVVMPCMHYINSAAHLVLLCHGRCVWEVLLECCIHLVCVLKGSACALTWTCTGCASTGGLGTATLTPTRPPLGAHDLLCRLVKALLTIHSHERRDRHASGCGRSPLLRPQHNACCSPPAKVPHLSTWHEQHLPAAAHARPLPTTCPVAACPRWLAHR
jgi:hypothetical protein